MIRDFEQNTELLGIFRDLLRLALVFNSRVMSRVYFSSLYIVFNIAILVVYHLQFPWV